MSCEVEGIEAKKSEVEVLKMEDSEAEENDTDESDHFEDYNLISKLLCKNDQFQLLCMYEHPPTTSFDHLTLVLVQYITHPYHRSQERVFFKGTEQGLANIK